MECTLESIVSLFLNWTAANRAPGTAQGYRRHLERFMRFVGSTPLHELRAWHLMTWGKTWHQIQAVQRCFSWAKNEAELIDRNPFSRVKKPTPRGRRRILSPREWGALLRAAKPDFRRLLITARETLCRPQEARALRWEWIHHDGTASTTAPALLSGQAYFRLSDFKARERRRDPHAARIIPITPTMGKMLLWLGGGKIPTSGEILKTWRGSAWTKERIRQRMRTARRRAGLLPDRSGEKVCLYTIRHTMATMASARGVRDRVLADVLGHTTTRTTARYQHLDVSHILDAMARIRSGSVNAQTSANVAPSLSPANSTSPGSTRSAPTASEATNVSSGSTRSAPTAIPPEMVSGRSSKSAPIDKLAVALDGGED